ncbi:MAG: hypothetical protein ACT4PZ_24675 [Panacagrimonas sp.]
MDRASSLSARIGVIAALACLGACSGGGTSRGAGDEGVDGTPIPTLPTNLGPILRGTIGGGTGSTRDEAVESDPFSIAALFEAAGLVPAAGNSQSLAGAIDDRGLPTASVSAIAGRSFTRPSAWPPETAGDSTSLPLPASVIDTDYVGAFDPALPAGEAWTAGWTVALDGTQSRWNFFGGPLAPGTSLFLTLRATANGQCPAGTTPAGRFSERFGALAGDETGLFFNNSGDYDVCRLPERFAGTGATGGSQPRLTNNKVYELADAVATFVGRGDAGSATLPTPPAVVLTVEAGTLIFGKPEQSLVVTRGARIEAVGFPTAPITFTSEQQLQARFDGDFDTAAGGEDGGWGGLALMGRAPNSGCGPRTCDIERIPFGRHGGKLPADRSGRLSYVVIRNGGGLPGTFGVPSFPSLSLLSTGRNTLIDRVQVHRGRDLGVVVDGGNSFLTHTAITEHGFLTSLSAGGGWTGGLQHLLVIPRPDASAGIAFDAFGSLDRDETIPVTFPLLANLSVLGANEGLEFDRALSLEGGARAQVWNSIFTGNYPGGCVDVDDDATFERADEAGGAPPDAPGPHLIFRNTVVDCTAVNFNENG